MYSRYQNSKGEPLQIPKHYSGCAFAPIRQEERPSLSTRHTVEAARPTPPPPLPPAPRKEESKNESKEAVRSSHTPHLSILEGMGKAFPFSHGIGSEELLLLGLILLLARNGQDSDMILWLALLLFSG